MTHIMEQQLGGNNMSNAKASKKSNVLMLTVMAMLTAIIFLFGLTPIGYLKIGVIEITFLQIPVIIGALLYGWKAGVLLGGMFGLTSFIQCFGMSPFGSVLFGINPLLTAVVCIVPRVLMGFFVGLISTPLIKADKTKTYSFLIPSLAGALLNTLFFMTALILCFWNTDYIQSMVATVVPSASAAVSATDVVSLTDITATDIISAADISATDAAAASSSSIKTILLFCVAFVGINGLVEAIICALLGTGIGRALYSAKKKMDK